MRDEPRSPRTTFTPAPDAPRITCPECTAPQVPAGKRNGENLGEFDAKGAWEQLNGTGFAEELTPTGLQLVIPGCERVAPDNGKPAQLSLF